MSWVCLMYHDIAPGPSTGGGGPDRFTVSVASFERMLDAILENGRVGCSLATALATTSGSPVAITFDDGTAGQYQHAVPALRSRQMSATFFVATDWVGTQGFMTWDQLRQLKGWGMSVQSHSKSHPHLSELDAEQLRSELVESKALLDRELGQDTSQIALPGGDAPRLGLRGLLPEAGYRVVATSRWGRNSYARSTANACRWVRRCTAPRALSVELANRILAGDRRLTVSRYSREAALNGMRTVLGASRYARWRRRFLDALVRR